MATKTVGNGHTGSYPQRTKGTQVEEHGGLSRIGVTIQGFSPLLMNTMGSATLLGIWSKEKSAQMAARPTPRQWCENRLYLLGDGRPYLPVRCLYACLIEAGRYVRMQGKSQISSKASTSLYGIMSIEDAELPLVKPGTDQPATWDVDIQQGRNPNGGEAVAVIRPRFDEWEFHLTIQVNQKQLAIPRVRELFDIAGHRVGLLDFRPARKGPYGQFVVSRWEFVDPND